MSFEARDVTLRSAEEDDCRFVWETNNDPTVRQNAIDTSEIPWSHHQSWYARTLEASDRLLYVGEYQGERCGVIRMDLTDAGNEAEVTVAVSEGFRGRGLGRRIIRKAAEKTLGETSAESVTALIREDNEPSIRAFEAAGFEREGRTTRQNVELLVFYYG